MRRGRNHLDRGADASGRRSLPPAEADGVRYRSARHDVSDPGVTSRGWPRRWSVWGRSRHGALREKCAKRCADGRPVRAVIVAQFAHNCGRALGQCVAHFEATDVTTSRAAITRFSMALCSPPSTPLRMRRSSGVDRGCAQCATGLLRDARISCALEHLHLCGASCYPDRVHPQDAARQLASDLEDVLNERLTPEAFRTRRSIYAICPELDVVLSALDHYLDDADIRARDRRYRDMQNAQMARLVAALREQRLSDAGSITFLASR